jgi:hypothetical protein
MLCSFDYTFSKRAGHDLNDYWQAKRHLHMQIEVAVRTDHWGLLVRVEGRPKQPEYLYTIDGAFKDSRKRDPQKCDNEKADNEGDCTISPLPIWWGTALPLHHYRYKYLNPVRGRK